MHKHAAESLRKLIIAKKGPVAKLLADAVRSLPGLGAVVDPEKLTVVIEAGGFKVTTYKPGDTPPDERKPLRFSVVVRIVTADDVIVARGMSRDPSDALAQAVLAWLKEEAAAALNIPVVKLPL